MNTSENLILYNEKDITENIRFCVYNLLSKKYDVTFTNGKTKTVVKIDSL